MRNTNLQAMIESAILAAFALIIDILPLSIKLPTGGSISFAMIPIFIIAYRWGFKMAFLGGLIWGFLQIVVGDAIYRNTNSSNSLSTSLPFAFIGFAGLFYRPIQKALASDNMMQSIQVLVVAKINQNKTKEKKHLFTLSLPHLSVALHVISVTLLPVLFSWVNMHRKVNQLSYIH